MNSDSNNKSRRVQPKEVRREQLIHATMRCIARNGLSGTTVAEVTREAGLSLGIANLHFQSKDKLLTETLRHVTDEYNRGQLGILSGDRYDSVAEKLEAVVDFDFSARVATRDKMAVWFAFWGEARSRPTYQRICCDTDFATESALAEVFQAAIEEGNYSDLDASMLASGYTALVDGLWLNMLIAPQHLRRKQARVVARNYLVSAFPRHLQAVAP